MGEGGAWASQDRRVLVRGPRGEARLWLAQDGELHDVLGAVRVYEACQPRANELIPEELAVFVAEWLACAIDRDGPAALAQIHPELRALVYELTPSAIAVSDEDADEVLIH